MYIVSFSHFYINQVYEDYIIMKILDVHHTHEDVLILEFENLIRSLIV